MAEVVDMQGAEVVGTAEADTATGAGITVAATVVGMAADTVMADMVDMADMGLD